MENIENQLQSILEQTFGFKSFRPGQREAVLSLLRDGRLLCVLPTGHGKSLLYQLPACLLGGITIVISPLLALMRDQIDHLNNRFKIPAAAINSDQNDEENGIASEAAVRGLVRVLFVAPEQLDHIDRFNFLLGLDVKLVVVDEAHCISTWGHDFRPSYRQIVHFIQASSKKNPDLKILGLTATADRRVEMDISRQLSFSNHQMSIIRESMNRSNIKLSVFQSSGIASKLALCERLLNQVEGCGLVYCATRENCELVADYLKTQGIAVAAYHAGFDPLEKRKLQQEFIADKYKALAATNALGMGIDKGNLRYIIHFDIPGSITAYYQEIGRSGRDGLNSQGILLYDPADRRIQEYFIDSAQPKAEDFESVVHVVKTAEALPNLNAIKRITGLHPTRVTIVVAELMEQGFLTKFSLSGVQVYEATSKQGQPDLSRYINQYEVKSGELKKMLRYSTQKTQCRMAILRSALGDEEVSDCGHCDVCAKTPELSISPEKVDAIQHWLNKRPLPIAPMVLQKTSAGLSILDGKARSPLFIQFMKERAGSQSLFGMDDELVNLLKFHLSSLASNRQIACIAPIPSRTWNARIPVVELLSKHLGVPVMQDLLSWKELPPKRQGELYNNDQRHENVHQRMQANASSIFPKGIILLFDDYIGSGNTIREAARAIRATKKIPNEIIPFTVAALKWHLGKPGFS